MSDPIEINRIYGGLEEDEFVSYDSLAGGSSDPGENGAENEDGGAPGNSPKRGSRSETEEILRQAREERDRMLAEQEELKQKAYEEGFASGREEGRRKGREEYSEKISLTADLINELAEARENLVGKYEAEILELIKVMVERLVQQEISQDKGALRNILKSALEYIVESSTVTVKLNRADIERLSADGEESGILAGEGRRSVELVEDEAISAGGCLIVTGSGEVDATLENRRDLLFASVDKALGDQKSEVSDQEAEDG
ncbi:MAG: FliH/SctL family protein [Desulfurivibrionaceae bacterium]